MAAAKPVELVPLRWCETSLRELGHFGRDDDEPFGEAKLKLDLDRILPFFNKRQWVKSKEHPNGTTDDRYHALVQSFMLASLMLSRKKVKVYMTLFLGKPAGPVVTETECGDCIQHDESADVGGAQIRNAERALANLAKHVFWVENPHIFSDIEQRNTGITAIGHPYAGEFDGQTADEIAEWDESFKRRNLPNRQFTVAIPTQYINAMVKKKNGSPPWLRAAFYAAYAMVHEIGHVIFWHNYKVAYEGGPQGDQEPRVGSDLHGELGDALMARVFDGWLIHPISLNDGQDPPLDEKLHNDVLSFRTGLCCMKQPRIEDHPTGFQKFRTYYSIGTDLLSALFTEDFFDGHVFFKTPFSSSVACRRAETLILGFGPVLSNSGYEDPNWRDDEVRPPVLNWTPRPHEFMPREQWVEEDLLRTGAMDPNFRHINSLSHIPLHPFFDRTAWKKVKDKSYDALIPSFQLATRLIELSTEYYTSFLPFSQYRVQSSWTDCGFSAGSVDWSIFINENPDEVAMNAARATLAEIAANTAWLESVTLARNGHWGLTNPGTPGKGKHDNAPNIKWDEEAIAEGKKTRPLVIKISTDFVDTLVDAEKDSARYLKAVLCSALTMVHEIGHAILYANFENKSRDMGCIEGWVGDDFQVDLGVSAMGWLFGGWSPELPMMSMGMDFQGAAYDADRIAQRRFESHLVWSHVDKWTSPRLVWRTEYSIPLSFVKRLFTQRNWMDVEVAAKDLPTELARSRYIRGNLLHPNIPFDPATTSRKLHRNVKKNRTGQMEWKQENYQRGISFLGGLDWDKYKPTRPEMRLDDEEELLESSDDEGQGKSLQDNPLEFSTSNEETWPYIDPYWVMDSSTGEISTADSEYEDHSNVDLRYGVEMELVFAFNENMFRAEIVTIAEQSPGFRKADVQIIKEIEYETRDVAPFNEWDINGELPLRAYNSWATKGKYRRKRPEGVTDLEPYTDEVPRMLASLLRETLGDKFKINTQYNALQSAKNAHRYKTWSVVPDSSVRGVGSRELSRFLPELVSHGQADDFDSYGMEIVSRVLTIGDADFTEIRDICRASEGPSISNRVFEPTLACHAFVTNTTALHVHIEAPSLRALKVLAFVVVIYEDELSRMHPLCQQPEHYTARNSIETNRTSFTSRDGSLFSPAEIFHEIFGKALSFNGLIKLMNPEPVGRHRLMNFTYANRGRDINTIEFRQHRGTLDFKDIKMWTIFCANLVNFAKHYTETPELEAEVMDSFQFSNWQDHNINIFALFQNMLLAPFVRQHYEWKIARYMSYPLDGELNAWHLELPPGDKRVPYGPPKPRAKPAGGSGPSIGGGAALPVRPGSSVQLPPKKRARDHDADDLQEESQNRSRPTPRVKGATPSTMGSGRGSYKQRPSAAPRAQTARPPVFLRNGLAFVEAPWK